MAWKPNQRAARRALQAPYPDVPDHLATPLWNWIRDHFYYRNYYQEEVMTLVATQLEISLDPRSSDAVADLRMYLSPGDQVGLLDAAELILEHLDTPSAPELDQLLESAHSLYRVRGDGKGLEERVAAGVVTEIEQVINDSRGSAGDHLTNAWNAAYGYNSDPPKSYSESIKAAEAALARHVSPQNSKQTLGTMIRDIQSKPEKWAFTIANVDAVETILKMMQLLWAGQTSRHGGTGATRTETAAEAKAAIHLAAALVQYGASGAFHPATSN